MRDWWGARGERRRRRDLDRRRAAEQDAATRDLDHIGTDYRPSTGWTDTRYQAPDPYGAYETAEPPPASARKRRKEQRRRERLGLPADHGPPSARRRERARTDQTERARSVGDDPGPRRAEPQGPPSPARAGAVTAEHDDVAPRRRTPRWYVAVPVVAVVVLLGGRLALGDGIGGLSFGPPPELEVRWELEGEDVVPDTLGSIGSVDGTVDGTVLATETGWVVAVEDYDASISSLSSDGAVATIDPDTGGVLWSTTLSAARCTLGDDALLCLAAQDDGVALLELDTTTGEVRESATTDLARPPVVLLPLADGLLAVDRTGVLSLLDRDGTVLWSEPAALTRWDPDVGETVAAVYPDAVWLNVGIGSETMAVTADGVAVRADCRHVAALEDGVICEGDDTIGYTSAGEELWVNDDYRDPRLVGRYQRITTFAVADLREGRLGVLDPATGEAGVQARLDDADDRPRSVIGDAQRPVVLTEEGSVVLLRPDGAGKVWESPIRDEYLSIAGGGVLDGVVVVDGEHAHGYDFATGERLWTYDSPGGDLDVVDGRLLGRGFYGLTVYELPED